MVNTIKCFEYASKHNPQVSFKVIDYHAKHPGIVPSFMQVVTRNANLTQKLAEDKYFERRYNLATERVNRIPFDRIAIAAKKAGIVPGTASRRDVRNNVAKYFKDKGLDVWSDAKLVCPCAKFFDDLVNNTRLIHELTYPDDHVPMNRSQMDLFGFEPSEFCKVDGDATLQDKVMQPSIEQYRASSTGA